MMESWNGSSEGKGLLFSDEMDLQNHAFATGRKTLMDWDNRPPYYFESDGLVPDRDAVEGMELLDLGFSDLERKPFLGNQGVEILSSEVVSDSSKRAASPTCMFTSDLCFDEVPSEVKFSTSPMGASSQDSSLIDLKLGTLAGCKEAENSKLLEKRLSLSSGSPFLPTKRSRKTSSYSQSAFCQVHGCNRDLSSSKDYHRRHRVCDVHSKTAKVIVNGIEQRFCQQCSRFHLLGEFDDGKRSCRKRLAGHNERRRKPQLDTHSATKYVGTSLPKKTPLVFPEILRAGIICAGKNEQANLFRHAKLEGELMNSGSQSATSETRGYLFPKSFFHLDGTGKQRWFEHSSSGDEDCTFTASTYHVLSGASTPNRALSLLSAQSQDLSSHLTGHPRAGPQILQGHSSNHVVPQTQKRLHVSSVEQWGSNGLYSHGINSMGADKIGSRMLPDASHAADFQVLTDGILQESDIMGANCFPSSEDGPTIDWLQLSSHLQRVERHRNSIQVKQENEDPCCLPTFRAVCNQRE